MTQRKPEGGDLFCHKDYSGMLLFHSNKWYMWNNEGVCWPLFIALNTEELRYLGNTGKILESLKEHEVSK